MKKVLLVMFLSLLLAFVGCDNVKEEFCTITFNSDGGTEVESQKLIKGQSIVKPTDPVKEGYTFDGWYVEDEKWSFYGYTANQSMELKAKWNVNSYTITILDSEDGEVVEVKTFEYGSEIALEDYQKTGYDFMGWSEELPEKMPAKNLVIYPVLKEQTIDDNLPTQISLKVEKAYMQINSTIKLTYTITPANAQLNNVQVTLSNNLATYTIEDNRYIVLTAGSEVGTLRVYVTTTNGLRASKAIKIQAEEVVDYPDLAGYTIKIAQAESSLGLLDVNLTKVTEDQYGYYSGADREFLQNAWKEIETNYNCKIRVEPYPSDAPWGPSRWMYILTQAQIESSEFDFYIVPNSQIPSFVADNAILDLTDWYAEYGKNYMDDMSITAGSYKGRLYAINVDNKNIDNILGYNINLWEKIKKVDSSIKEPAQMYLDDNWNFNTFKDYCIKVQRVLDTMSTEEEKYYCLSGYGTYYWQGLVNASGVKILDTTQLKVNIMGTVEAKAAEILRDLYAAGCIDPAFQVDEGVVSWNTGHSLFNTGNFWFVNDQYRWSNNLWGEDNTKYGYVPFPSSTNINYFGLASYGSTTFVMSSGRNWAYVGFGTDCTAKNIFRAYMDYYATANKYYTNSEGYSSSAIYESWSNNFGSDASKKAYLKATIGVKQLDGTYKGGLSEYTIYDPFASSNAIVSSYGASGTFAGDINYYIKGSDTDWGNTVGVYENKIKKQLLDIYG